MTFSEAGTRRQKQSRAEMLLQSGIGWAALMLALLSSLANGGFVGIAWVALCIVTLLLFAIQVGLDFRQDVPVPASAVMPVAFLYVAVLLWLQFQTMSGVPGWLAHPVWELAPDPSARAITARPDLGQQVVMRLTCYGMLFWILLRSSHSGARAMSFIKAIALFSTALAIYGIQARLSGVNPLLGIEQEGNAVRASFTNRNSYATFAGFGVLANLSALYAHTYRTEGGAALSSLRNFLESFFAWGWLYALGGLICLTALALTASRAGGAAGLVGVMTLVVALRQKKGGGYGFVWIMLAGVVGFVLLTSAGQVADRIENAGPDLRFVVYPHIIDGITDRPFLGHGVGAFHDTFRAYSPFEAAGAEWAMAHSSYLDNAYEFGLPAAAAFFLSLALIGGRLLDGVRRRRHDQVIPAFALACFVAAALHSLVDFSLQIPAVAATFAAILGIGWAQSFTSQGKSRSKRRRQVAETR